MDSDRPSVQADHEAASQAAVSPRQWRVLVWQYSLAPLAVAAAYIVHTSVSAWAAGSLPHFIMFYPAVLLVALVAGVGPGLLATALSAAVADVRLMPPLGSWYVALPADRVALALFCLNGTLVCAVAELYRRTCAKAAAYDRDEAVRASEARLRMQRERMPIGCIVFDDRNCFSEMNPAAERIFGYTSAELRGHHANVIVPESARPHVDGILRRLAEGDMTAHSVHENVAKDGRTIVCQWTNTPLRDRQGAFAGFLSMVEDITQRKRAEEEIRRAKEEWERTFDSVPDLIAILDERHRVVRANRAMAQRLGATPEKCVGVPCYQAVHGADGPPSFCPHSQTLRDLQVHSEEVHEQRLGGDFLVTTTPLTDASGKFLGAVHVARDVTERKRSEGALRESEAKYRNLFENMTEEVHFWKLVRDESGQIKTWRLVDANPPTLATWGKTLDEIRGKTTDEIFGPGATEHYLPVVRKIVTEGVPHSFEDYFPHLDRYFRFTSVPLGEYFITTGADITSIKKSEEALKVSLREKEVLLKEIHHRVKNNMQVISSLVDLQAGQVQDEAMRTVLQDVTYRVRSMALVHEKLYQSAEMAGSSLPNTRKVC